MGDFNRNRQEDRWDEFDERAPDGELQRPSPGKASRTHGGGTVRGIPGTVLTAANIDETVHHMLQNVKGLTDEQARFLLEQVQGKGGTIVFGGSRVRGAPKLDDLGRVVSDLDVGFEGLTQNQITKIVNKFNKRFTGHSQGANRIIEHTWIHPGSQPRSIPEIVTPEEFFARFGIRADGRNIGKPFGPSGHVKRSWLSWHAWMPSAVIRHPTSS